MVFIDIWSMDRTFYDTCVRYSTVDHPLFIPWLERNAKDLLFGRVCYMTRKFCLGIEASVEYFPLGKGFSLYLNPTEIDTESNNRQEPSSQT